MKFGGTSVEDGAAIGRTAAIVAERIANGKSPVVVVSAMAKVTDQLLRAAAAAAQGDRTGALAISSRLRSRHRDTACALIKDAAAITALMTGRAYAESARVAAALGPYERYEENREEHNAVMRMHRDAAYAIADDGMCEPQLLAAARAANIPIPYAGFTGSVAQALSPFPQYQDIENQGVPLGSTTYNAAQFTATNGPLARGLRKWIAFATSSLPVPDSPRTSTVTSVCATFSIVS